MVPSLSLPPCFSNVNMYQGPSGTREDKVVARMWQTMALEGGSCISLGGLMPHYSLSERNMHG